MIKSLGLVALAAAATAAGAAQVIVGSQDFQYNIPFCGSWWTQTRVQVLILKTELNFTGVITKVEYQASAAASNASFGNFELKLCHTPLSVLTTNYQNNYGGQTPVVVATANPLVLNVTANQWFGFNCSPAFNYNNAYNLIVEVRWQNSGGGTEVDTWGYDAGTMRLLIYKDYNATDGELSSKLDRFRFTYSGADVTATSLGRVKTLYR